MLAVEPTPRSALAKIYQLRAAAEPIEARFGAGQRPDKSPSTDEIERLRAGEHERDDVLRLAVPVGADPKRAGTALGIGLYVEPKVGAFAFLERVGLLAAYLFGAGRVRGCAHVVDSDEAAPVFRADFAP